MVDIGLRGGPGVGGRRLGRFDSGWNEGKEVEMTTDHTAMSLP